MIVLAVIFAGGRGSRLGGCDKALLELGGRPLITHVTERIRPTVTRIVINANGDPARFAGPVQADDPASALDGPFRALETALRLFAADTAATHLLHVPTDVPFLPADLVPRLAAVAAPAAFPRTGTRSHPVICLWTRAGAARAQARLAHHGGERLDSFLTACGGLSVAFDDEAEAFLNINRPADLETAARLLPL